jgi:hypothetical protein
MILVTVASGALDDRIPHTFRNVGPTTGKLLLTVIPGGFSNYFLDVDGVPDADLEAIKALCARYGVEILG